MRIKFTGLSLLIVGLILLVCLPLVRQGQSGENVPAERLKQLLQQVDDELVAQNAEAATLVQGHDVLQGHLHPSVIDQHVRQGLELMIIESQELVYWSDNEHALNPYQSFNPGKHTIRHKDQWLRLVVEEIGEVKLVSSVLLEHDTRLNNRFTRAGFAMAPDWMLDVVEEPIDQAVLWEGEKSNVYVQAQFSSHNSDELAAYDWLLLLVHCFLFAGVYFIGLYPKQSWKHALFFMVSVIFIRWLGVWLSSGSVSGLFAPEIYASSQFFPSLGDLFLSVIALLALSESIQFFLVKANRTRVVVLAILFALITGFIANLMVGLVIDSSISFNVNNVLALNSFSVIGIICMAILMFMLYRVVRVLNPELSKSSTSFRWMILICLTALNTIWGFVTRDWTSFFWIQSLIIISGFGASATGERYIGPWLYLVVFSAYAGVTVTAANRIQVESETALVARRIVNSRDPVGEILFKESRQRIASELRGLDERQSLDQWNAFELASYCEQLLPSYFDKYDFRVYLYDSLGNAFHPVSGDKRKHEISYFHSLTSASETTPVDAGLFFTGHTKESEDYVIYLSFTKERRMVITLSSDVFPEDLATPFPLQHKESAVIQNYAPYSYAIYKNDKLVRSGGNYSYSTALNSEEAYQQHGDESYTHSRYAIDQGWLIVSRKAPDQMAAVTTFSYFFLILGGLTLLVVWAKSWLSGELSLDISLNQKIQFSLVALVLSALVIFGWVTMNYLTNQWELKNKAHLQEKLRSVQIEVEHKLGDAQSLEKADLDYLHYLLSKFSKVFFSDITLFRQDGALLATSRPELFYQGLQSGRMDPNAHHAMYRDRLSMFTQEESIGDFNYVSAYAPFRNQAGQTLAYLNLPYFAKQGELGAEISSFLVTFINICVLLFALTVTAALLITNLLTKPLRMIHDKLVALDLGKTNQTIVYRGNDEIGELIRAYNAKVNELEQSAALLAQSEREGAWREMAKQVAHEIKNPLTPMKLNVQMMDRAWRENDPDWESRWKKFTQSMIEQIDTLSSIASAFSNFARMPGMKQESLDLCALAQSVVDLYGQGKVKVELVTSLKQANVAGDKEQLGRMLQNLVKNAVQATEELGQGEVYVTIAESDEDWLIHINDNGNGIPLDQQGQIFEPNFTTKTGGTGLGLAMVKSIVLQHQGSVDFTSSEKGTTFTVVLQKLTS